MFSYCAKCIIRNCEYFEESGKKYCFSCPQYPCARLKQLDRRYRGKYSMSMLENLEYIKTNGVRKFVKKEKDRWKCVECGELISCHWRVCASCETEMVVDVRDTVVDAVTSASSSGGGG